MTDHDDESNRPAVNDHALMVPEGGERIEGPDGEPCDLDAPVGSLFEDDLERLRRLPGGDPARCAVCGGPHQAVELPVHAKGHAVVCPEGGASKPDPALQEKFQALREAGGDGWDKVDDPAALLGRDDPALAMDTPEMMTRRRG